jgi:hypothetical protein
MSAIQGTRLPGSRIAIYITHDLSLLHLCFQHLPKRSQASKVQKTQKLSDFQHQPAKQLLHNHQSFILQLDLNIKTTDRTSLASSKSSVIPQSDSLPTYLTDYQPVIFPYNHFKEHLDTTTLMSVDIRQSLNCLRFPSRYESISRTQLSKQHTGDSTREAEKHSCPCPFCLCATSPILHTLTNAF